MERESKVENTVYKYNRDDMIEKVSKIIFSHIEFAEENIKPASHGAMLFDANTYDREQFEAHMPYGFCSVQPIFIYTLEKVDIKITE